VSLAAQPETGSPLDPLVAALVDRARRDAAEVLAAAEAEAQQVLGAARADADALLAEARSRGAADAAALLAAERARAERTARGVVLAAQQAAHESARQAAREAVSQLCDDPAYPPLVAALRARAVRELGPGVEVTELAGGGLVAEAGGRRLEFDLADLADDLLDSLDRDRAELWAR
jgi:vacuolar-type H+-ATPase subunit E/Vma4